MHFCLVLIQPDTYLHAQGLADVMLPMRFALQRLGFSVKSQVNAIDPTATNIVFGMHTLNEADSYNFPANTIIFNLEQVSAGDTWFTETYIKILRSYTVWDYSLRNCSALQGRYSVNATWVKLGYVPEMTRLKTTTAPTYDVLFYGLVNERRRKILEALQADRIKLAVPQTPTYGIDRDALLFQSSLILNIHYYQPASLEIARLGYLFANKKPVVSELNKDTECYDELRGACAFSPYEHLPFAVNKLLNDKKLRDRQAQKGFDAFSALRQEDILEKIVGRKQYISAPLVPQQLHVGSGRDFYESALNIDIAAHCNPDLLLDISVPLDFEKRHTTRRFGEISLRRESFTLISAFEVLEHIHDLPQAMQNLRDLLALGGELHISVPYDLSHGAWQDPTHIRTFNEHSWLYYTAWHWYMQWRDSCFEVTSLTFDYTPLGQQMLADGAEQKLVLRTPRAVHGMRVIMIKRETTEKEKAEYDLRFRTFYHEPTGDWTL